MFVTSKKWYECRTEWALIGVTVGVILGGSMVNYLHGKIPPKVIAIEKIVKEVWHPPSISQDKLDKLEMIESIEKSMERMKLDVRLGSRRETTKDTPKRGRERQSSSAPPTTVAKDREISVAQASTIEDLIGGLK